MFYEAKLSIEKEMPPKKISAACEMKVVNEHYICDCENIAEAYYKLLELYNNKCDVTSVSISKIQEIVNEKVEDKPFFRATIVDVYTTDDGEEKENKFVVLVCAKDVTEANNIMQDYLKQGYDMKLIGINRTKILDLI